MWVTLAHLNDGDGIGSHGIAGFGPYDSWEQAKDARPRILAWAEHLGYQEKQGEVNLELIQLHHI